MPPPRRGRTGRPSTPPAPLEPAAAADSLTDRFLGFLAYLRETYEVDMEIDPDELGRLTADEKFDRVISLMSSTGLTARLPEAVMRHQITSHLDTRALDEYQPDRYAGSVTLYRSTQPTPWAVHDPRTSTPTRPGDGTGSARPAHVPIAAHHQFLDPPAVTIANDLRRPWSRPVPARRDPV
jgi:hypothetical protein